MPIRLETQSDASTRLVLANQTHYKTHYRHYCKDKEQYLGNFNSAGCNTPKPEHSSNQCNYQKDNRVVKHVSVLVSEC